MTDRAILVVENDPDMVTVPAQQSRAKAGRPSTLDQQLFDVVVEGLGGLDVLRAIHTASPRPALRGRELLGGPASSRRCSATSAARDPGFGSIKA